MTTPALVAIGFSSGGLPVAAGLLGALPDRCHPAIAVVAHTPPGSSTFASVLAARTRRTVREAEDKARIERGVVHTAPGGFHLLVEDEEHFALSLDDRVSHSRPSLTVLFESASITFGREFVAVVLGGANDDGAAALPQVRRRGGTVLVQAPESTRFPQMPRAAVGTCADAEVLTPAQLSLRLNEIVT